MTRHCHFCGQEIDPDGMGVWRRVVGWERKATSSSRRSGSDITLRERQDDYAHTHCIDGAKRGLSPRQGALL